MPERKKPETTRPAGEWESFVTAAKELVGTIDDLARTKDDLDRASRERTAATAAFTDKNDAFVRAAQHLRDAVGRG